MDWVRKEFAVARNGVTFFTDPLPIPPMDVQSTIEKVESDYMSPTQIRREVEEYNRVLGLEPLKACPALGEVLQDKSVRSQASTGDPVSRSLQLTFPHVDLTSGIASFEVEDICHASLCGERVTVYYRIENGEWQFFDRQQHWVS